jgi:hypothetical protein
MLTEPGLLFRKSERPYPCSRYASLNQIHHAVTNHPRRFHNPRCVLKSVDFIFSVLTSPVHVHASSHHNVSVALVGAP